MVTDAHADTIRNIAVVSSAGAGKTSLVEALLYTAGAIPAMGAVGNGSTVSDFEPEEIHRKVSVSTAAAHFPWKGVTFNLLDTPGAMSFLGEAELALHAVDGVLIVLGAASGMRTELEKLWGTIADLGLPCILFVNELDKERTVLETVLKACEDALEIRTVPVAAAAPSLPLQADRNALPTASVPAAMAVWPRNWRRERARRTRAWSSWSSYVLRVLMG